MVQCVSVSGQLTFCTLMYEIVQSGMNIPCWGYLPRTSGARWGLHPVPVIPNRLFLVSAGITSENNTAQLQNSPFYCTSYIQTDGA